MPLNFPDIFPTEGEAWSIMANNHSTQSPFTGAKQVESWDGSKWVCDVSFNNVPHEVGRRLAAFFARLNGSAETFFYGPYLGRHLLGNASGSPSVSGSGQSGTTLNTVGWPANTPVLDTGDYIEVNGELKIIVEDSSSNGAGAATLTIAPALRESPPNAASINYSAPKCVMRLIDDNQTTWRTDKLKYHSFTLRFEEAI